jgi:hypothetical protein
MSKASPRSLAVTSLLLVVSIGTAIAVSLPSVVNAQETPPRPTKDSLLALYDLSDPRVDIDKIVAPGVAQDGIPPLTDPERVAVFKAEYPELTGRVIEVVINGKAVAYPIGILNFHEIANDTVGGEPIAATYCPLCDSASVISRNLEIDGETLTLEFGVSGFLYNSNVMMYEKTTNGLWSQVLMQAVTGPHSGRTVKHYPVRVISFMDFKSKHPKGEVLTANTGHERPYSGNPYQAYFDDPDRVFPGFDFHDDRLGHKALGMGVVVGDSAYFVPQSATSVEPVTFKTEHGAVTIKSNDAGMQVVESPESAQTIQTFWHSWAAFHPDTEIISE